MDIISKYPAGVIWANLSLREKNHLKNRYFNGCLTAWGNITSREDRLNSRAKIKGIGAKKTFNPIHGKKFSVIIPPISTFLQQFYCMTYDVHGPIKSRDHKNIKLIVNTKDFEELLDFCNYFSNFFYIFYLDSQLKKLTKNQVIRIMRNHKGIYRVLPNEFKSDRTIAELALRSNNCNLLAFAPPSILNSNLFFQLAVSKYIDALYYFSEKITHKKENMKYLESQLFKIELDKTLNKLPAKLKKKYFENISEFSAGYNDYGRSTYKPFPLKTLIENCNSIESFSKALSYGAKKHNRAFRLLKDLRKVDIYSLPGYKLFFIIALIAEDYENLKKLCLWKDEEPRKYFQFITNIIDLKDSNDVTAFGTLSPFQIATIQSELNDSSRKQIEEIVQLREKNELRSPYEDQEADIPF